jgi:hypothetical protein
MPGEITQIPVNRDPVQAAATRVCAVWPRWRASQVPYSTLVYAIAQLDAAVKEARS